MDELLAELKQESRKAARKKTKNIKSGIGTDASEFSWINGDSAVDEKTLVSDLVGALKNAPNAVQQRLGDLKKNLYVASKRQRSLAPPVTDSARVRAERVTAYKEVSKEVSDWSDIIKQNRLASKLTFPLNEERVTLEKTEEQIQRFSRRTNLEKKTAEILGSSKHNLKNDEPLTAAESAAVSMAFTAEQVEERRKQLLRMRNLVSYAERKIAWQNKIKSKNYHRIRNRAKKKAVEAELKELLEKDPAAALKKLEMLDRDRIKERATLRHRGTGRWAKHIRFLTKKDPRLREAMEAQLRLGRELAKKHELAAARRATNRDDDPDSGAEGEENEDQTEQDPASSANSQWAKAQPLLQMKPLLIAEDNEAGDGRFGENADDLMAEAFADDDVIDEYREEMVAEMNKEDDEAADKFESDLSLPGWNSWIGPGTENMPANRRRQRQLEKFRSERDKVKKKRLQNWSKPIVNKDAVSESMRKLQVGKLPFPFDSATDFELDLQTPLGKEWNPGATQQMLVEPAIITKMGAVIKPINRETAMAKKSVRGLKTEKKSTKVATTVEPDNS